MICKNCGAEFDNTLPKCPYCGNFNYEGAQKEYMEKLEDIHEDLDDLHEEVQDIYKTEMKKQAKGIRKILIIIVIIFAVLAALFFITELMYDSGSYDPKAVLLFEQEAFPIADEYYEAGDYEGLLEFCNTSIEENKHASFYNWDHYGFLLFYDNYTGFFFYANNLDGPDATDFDLHEVFYYYIAAHYDQKGFPISPEDQQLIEPLSKEMKSYLDSLELTDEEVKAFNDLLNSSQYPSWDDIEDFAKKVYKRKYK